MPQTNISEHVLETERHRTFYLSAGPEYGPLVILTHGWPELSLSWRHQLPFLGAMGFRAVAPDMRGYGQSSVYPHHADYSQELVVKDMLELIDSLDREKAIWIGHDWGSPVAWNMASHHPERCYGVASLCIPYSTIELGLESLINMVDRSVYPEDKYPAGQWDYMRFYEENFQKATEQMDANPFNMVQLLFRKGSPEGMGLPAATASIRQAGGWFGGLPEAPDFPRDEDVVTEADLNFYADELKRNGFFGPNSWYMNHEANAVFNHEVVNHGVIEIPALFLAARFDYTCESVASGLAEPMRDKCVRLSEKIIESGHWMAQEKPREVNRELVKWLVRELPELLA
ncbi:MAG: alpha/beta hydrolase [Pseudomonadales bacterium]|jgi:pimeloyl-ACP methyl ester carboxylesterase|nr:alpha/beta hydrolase [Pseudomonadales bacterium]|tara:strand:- start:1017 stop:2045 length:1029 start_codon:yes stop_codon:yes gene_type:complete